LFGQGWVEGHREHQDSEIDRFCVGDGVCRAINGDGCGPDNGSDGSDDAGSRHDVLGVGVRSGLGRQEHEQGPEALATGLHEVAGGARHERRPAADVSGQRPLDHLHPRREPTGEGLIGHRHRQSVVAGQR